MTIEQIVLKSEKIDQTGCHTCATDYEARNLQHALARLNGVSKVKVDKITGRVILEYDTQKISDCKITERIEKLGYQVEIESKDEVV
ncbi:MAG: cation transporter [Thermoproteota archaeon]